jgi:putative ABC transport system permease protein
MLRNYITVTLRNMLRDKTSTLIKVTSLSVGLICFSIISLFVYHELSFDRFHKKPNQIYRVVKDFVNDDGSIIPDATTPSAMAPAIWRDLPEVASATRIFPNWGRKYLLQVADSKMYEENLMRIDSSFFNVFSFPFVKGDSKNSLLNPDFILLTESTAKRYFKDQDPMGKAIKIDLGPNGKVFFVTGILKDVPGNSHFSFDFLISIRSFEYGGLDTDWGFYNFYTYARLKSGTDPSLFISKLQPLFKKHNPENNNRYYAQQLTDIHLKSDLKWELKANGDDSYLKILSIIAIFIVCLAAINYVNLVTAQSARRFKEVGIRKVSGAQNGILIRQFLLESVILTCFATLISISLAEAMLPSLSYLFGANLSFFSVQFKPVLLAVSGIGLLIGVLAGIYPAFHLSSLRPVTILKGAFSQGRNTIMLRKSLVIFQFVISTSLIIGTMVISNQIDFIRSKNLGFNKDNIVIINNAGGLQNKHSIVDQIKKIGGVQNVGGADGVLGGLNWTTSVQAEGQKNEILLNFLSIDYAFLNVMGVSLKQGRIFSSEHTTDTSAIVINEAALKQLNIKEPIIGSRLVWATDNEGKLIYATIIGVIENFHFTSFHDPIKPFGFVINESAVNNLFVKVERGNISTTITEVEKVWQNLADDRPFEFSFQDEQITKLYSNEQKFQNLFSYFMVVAILIACLGILGLSAFTAQQRTKEIGIRKVLGASVLSISQLLSKDYLRLVVLAIAISIPLAWYLMNRWLEDFAYRIEINAWIFVSASLVAIGITLFTVSFQSIKAALTNPVKSLRNE